MYTGIDKIKKRYLIIVALTICGSLFIFIAKAPVASKPPFEFLNAHLHAARFVEEGPYNRDSYNGYRCWYFFSVDFNDFYPIATKEIMSLKFTEIAHKNTLDERWWKNSGSGERCIIQFARVNNQRIVSSRHDTDKLIPDGVFVSIRYPDRSDSIGHRVKVYLLTKCGIIKSRRSRTKESIRPRSPGCVTIKKLPELYTLCALLLFRSNIMWV